MGVGARENRRRRANALPSSSAGGPHDATTFDDRLPARAGEWRMGAWRRAQRRGLSSRPQERRLPLPSWRGAGVGSGEVAAVAVCERVATRCRVRPRLSQLRRSTRRRCRTGASWRCRLRSAPGSRWGRRGLRVIKTWQPRSPGKRSAPGFTRCGGPLTPPRGARSTDAACRPGSHRARRGCRGPD